MPGEFCIICGTTNGPFINGMCKHCYQREVGLEVTSINEIHIHICPLCHSISLNGVEIESFGDLTVIDSLRQVIYQTILENLCPALDDYSYSFQDDLSEDRLFNRGIKSFTVSTTINATPIKGFGELSRTLFTSIKTHWSVCHDCSRYKSKYHEAIIQIRAEKRPLTSKEEKRIEHLIRSVLESHSTAKMTYVFDYKVDKNGITAKVSTKYLAETIARTIKHKMSAKMSVAYSLKTTAKDGTEVYTNTYLVKLPILTEEDIIEYNNKIWLVKGVRSKLIILESLEDHIIKKIDRKKVESSSRKRNNEIITRKYMFIAQEGKTAIIMALDNYESYEERIEKLPKNSSVGDNLTGFLLADKNYYISQLKD